MPAVYLKYKKWFNTKSISQAGKLWVENGSYCPFPESTDAYYEFWDEQEYYIKEGYNHEGERVAGLHYLYLNYCLIKDKKKRTVTIPDFWAVDAEYFLEVERAMALGPWRDKDGNPLEPFRPPVFSVAKSRQVGASLKGVVPLLFNMNFVPHSRNSIGSYIKDDAEKTCKMFLNYFYHTQKYCEFGKRFIKAKDMEYYMTGYYEKRDGENVPAGYQSELYLISWKDNPEKGVGGGVDLQIVEEAGLHPELIKTVKYLEPAMKDGDYTTGTIMVYGAAGKETQFDGIKKLHNNPKAYKAMAYENRWEPDSHHKITGYFIPNCACRKGHMDEDGNPDIASAIAARDKALADLENTDFEAYTLELSQYPNTPSEMFNSRGHKRFNTKLIERQIAYLEGHSIYGEAVELYEDLSQKADIYGKYPIKWHAANPREMRPIRTYPLEDKSNMAGCVEIFEFPDPNPPDGLYIGGIDSYNQETSQSDSLGSIFIYKKVSSLAGEGTHRIIVAEYTGRPPDKNDWYRICAYLLQMYNAIAMLENEDHEASPWFVNNGWDHRLADQPDIIRLYVKDSKVSRKKGIHADIHLIIAAENKIARYINEKLGVELDDQGNVIGERFGVNRILSLGLLYELKEYISEKNKNFDRARSIGWTFMYEEETALQSVKVAKPEVQSFLNNTSRFRRKGPPVILFGGKPM